MIQCLLVIRTIRHRVFSTINYSRINNELAIRVRTTQKDTAIKTYCSIIGTIKNNYLVFPTVERVGKHFFA